jgi:dolichol-phosphate mannosyltransferase
MNVLWIRVTIRVFLTWPLSFPIGSFMKSDALTTVYVVLPAYNEASALSKLIPEIADVLRSLGVAFQVCVADDGSRDSTAELLRKLADDIPLRHLRHSTNQGYGAALNTGFTWVAQTAQATDIALFLDADNTHSPRYFPAMIEKVLTGFDIVTCSYSMNGGRAFGVPLKRRMLSLASNTLLRIAIRVPGTRSYTTGFRAIHASLLRQALQAYPDRLIEESGFAGGTELFLKLAQLGARTTEIPFDLHYENRDGGSKINIRRTIGCYLRLIGRYGRPFKSL